MEIELHLPAKEDGVIEEGLCEITEALSKANLPISGGLLGGQFGYGGEIDNDIFMMHPYCWCEREDCPWCAGCTCPESAFHYFIDGKECSSDEWFKYYEERVPPTSNPEWEKISDEVNTHRTQSQDKVCDYCQEKIGHAPNFHHKKSGLKINWYKYIGRSMEFNRVPTLTEWEKIKEECIASIPQPTPREG